MLRDVFYYGSKPNAHPREKRAIDLVDARQQCTTEHFWIINEYCDYTNFDWDWDFDFLPDEEVWTSLHNNVWPSHYQKDSGTWLCSEEDSGIIIYRADVDPIVRKNIKNDNWVILDKIDESKFNFAWHPDPTDPPYIYKWGCKFYPVEIKSYVEYHVDGATNVKYMSEVVELLPELHKWVEVQSIDNFDFTWRPDPREPAYIYTWGNKHIDATLKPTLEYHCEGATERKYMDNNVNVLPEWDKWVEIQAVDNELFDFSWRPDPREPAYIYTWGNKHIDATIKPTIEYHCEGATERKYMSNSVGVLPEWDKWVELQQVDKSTFDFSWRPNPKEPAYIYVWGNQWNKPEDKIAIQYVVEGATEYKYMEERATIKPCKDNWETPTNVIESSFDYSWEPDLSKYDPPYIYQFGTIHQKTGGPRYVVSGATEIKYIDIIKAKVTPDKTNWIIPKGFDESNFDFSWHPDATSPPYIYQFGTLLEDVHLQDGPKYVTPNNDGTVVLLKNTLLSSNTIRYPQYYIETTLDALIEQHKDEIFWALRKNIDYATFDFDWQPTKEQAFTINTFGSPESETTQTYLINSKMWQNGYKELNFIENTKLDEEYLATLFKQVDAFFVDKGNKESTSRFEQLKIKFPNITKTRYLNSWVDTINRCINKSTTELCWILNSELDYDNFDFNYYPNPWQMKMVHVFGTQWSHWGSTFMVNKETFSEDTKYVKIIEHLSNLNFVKTKRAIASNCLYDVYLIDYGNEGVDNIVSLIESKTKREINTIKYETDYLTTMKNMLYELGIKKDHYIWVCSSICDYTRFDFTYICDPFSIEQMHVFPSDLQKFGDTFFINVNKLRILVENLDKLENIEKINFNQHQRVTRLPAPNFITESDTHVSITNTTFNWPYATFVTEDNKEINVVDHEPISMWSSESKNILITSTGGTRIIVPKEASKYVEKELYDYPYINKASKLIKSKPLDIIFLSNGEAGADENYEHLLNVTKNLSNRVIRVDGVNGRVAAYHAAALASQTPWMFTVFAKLKVNSKFDWTWQPDRLQIPKHYIFYASNPVNGLVYGHQAMIAYNKQITLSNMGKGLDFTLDSEHEVVEINSGVAKYNTDEFSAWRTSFREAIKLRLEDSTISRHRLKIWSTVGEGDFAQYSIQGAQHAVEYYESVNGELDKLRLSYDWPWLQEYFNTKYN